MVHIQVPFMHITQEVLFTHANMPSIHETPVQFFQRLILPAEMFVIVEVNDKRLTLLGISTFLQIQMLNKLKATYKIYVVVLIFFWYVYPDVVLIFVQCTGSTHLFCFMALCFMCYSTCWPLYPWGPSWRELWDQSVSCSWCSFLQQLMQFSISSSPSWWIIILYTMSHILWMNVRLAFLELYSQW